jgi:hypothetical protein
MKHRPNGRLSGKTAIIVGAGQTPNEPGDETIGNGRAMAILFASTIGSTVQKKPSA